jgi:hypothetical protein
MLRARGLARLSLLLVVVVTVLISVLAIAGALAGTPGGGSRSAASGARAGAASAVRVYFTSGEQIIPVVRAVRSSGETVAAAIRSLLAGPTAGERRNALDTAVPAGTRLRSVTVDDGTAKIVLNAGFATGAHNATTTNDAADSADSAGLAQLTFTATAIPGIRKVQVSAPGMKTQLLTRRLPRTGGRTRAYADAVWFRVRHRLQPGRV